MNSYEKCLERVERLPPEVKVRMAIEMTEPCVQIYAEGIRAQFPGIGEEELVERVRES